MKVQPRNSFVFPLLAYLAFVDCASTYHIQPDPEGNRHLERQAGNAGCALTQPTAKAPRKNIWATLTDQELTDAVDFLYKFKELNLTKTSGSWANTIESVDLLHPNKTDVLPYLADTKPAPARDARAMLMFRSAMEPYMQEWMVGPLPISNQTKAQPLTSLSTRKSDNKLRVYNPDFGAAAKFDENITSLAANAIKTLWNVDPEAVSTTTVHPTQVDNGKVTVWQGFIGSPSGQYDTNTLLPLGLYVRSDRTGRDASKWKIEGWLYNNIFYKTIDEFNKALAQPGFQKLGMVVDGPWAQLDK
ncbi:DUF1965-domain-containing protein [Cadophora sp. DSE1049]|nr:DUF1965-domain-containing protein [Cadophora sp. DSE1049]